MRDHTIKPDAPTDMELVAAVKRGDTGALSTLYDRHSRLVYSLAQRIVQISTDAEEITQDTFFQMWQQADRIDQKRGSVLAWLIVVTRSRAIDRLRSRKKLKAELGQQLLERIDTFGAANVWDRVDSDERADIVKRALQEIPMEQRQALELAFYQGMSQAEIAAQLNEPVGTIKTRVRLGMKKLRESLANYVGEYESAM